MTDLDLYYKKEEWAKKHNGVISLMWLIAWRNGELPEQKVRNNG